jgi:hypothetical protein
MSKKKMTKVEFIGEVIRQMKDIGYVDIGRSAGGLFVPQLTEDQKRAGAESNDEKADYHFVISDETPDDWGTAFLERGAKLDPFKNNAFVTYSHPWLSFAKADEFIGRSPYIKYKDGKLCAGFNYQKPQDVDGVMVSNMNALQVKAQLDQGIVKCASIHARATQGGFGGSDGLEGLDPDIFYFTDWTLLTWGILPFGSNTNAVLISRAMETENKEEVIEEEEEEKTNEVDDEKNDEDEMSKRSSSVISRSYKHRTKLNSLSSF